MKILFSKKFLTHVLCAVIVLTSLTSTAFAAQVQMQPSTPTAVNTSIQPRADQITTEYRIHNGVLQYRRWNATKGVWVDPYWINCD